MKFYCNFLLKLPCVFRSDPPRLAFFGMPAYELLALVLRLSENKNSYECGFFTTNLFVANLLKHLRSCQFTG